MSPELAGAPPIHIGQKLGRNVLTDDTNRDVVTMRKTARILAVQMHEPFTVETYRGVMRGAPGDWLVTNHPDDDGTSDVWSISAERMAATYEPATSPEIRDDPA